MKRSIVIMAFALTGCAGLDAPISNQPIVNDLAGSSVDVVAGVKELEFNLSNGVEVGILKPDNRALLCARSFLADNASTEVKSFVPKTGTFLGKASVIYIREQQLEMARDSGIPISMECEALLWRILSKTAKDAAGFAPGMSQLKSLIR